MAVIRRIAGMHQLRWFPLLGLQYNIMSDTFDLVLLRPSRGGWMLWRDIPMRVARAIGFKHIR